MLMIIQVLNLLCAVQIMTSAMTMMFQVLICFMLLKFHLCLVFQDDEVHYIAPESLSACPVHSRTCLTLSEFVVSSKINSHTIVAFLPGNHALSSSIYITNVTRFSMISSSTLQRAEITCQHNTNFIFDEIRQVAIQRLIFVGCGSNKVSSCNHLTVKNCTFIGQNGSGTALEVVDTNAQIFNSIFAFNVVGSYQGPVGILDYWKGTFAAKDDSPNFAYVGGAIIANHSNMTIQLCYFEGNVAHIGGAIYSTVGSSISIFNCTFIKNFALQRFNFKLATFGGAIHCENGRSLGQSIAVLFGNTFHNNSASCGGAISAVNNTNIKIISSNFSVNSASLQGGVLAMYNHSTIEIHRNLFVNNHVVAHGGALMIIESTLSLSKCHLYYTRAQFGGVMTLARYSNVIIWQSKFFGNIAQFGGVISMAYDNVTIIHSEFNYNRAETQGAVVSGDLQPVLYINNCSFSNNVANLIGGGVIVLGHSKSFTINGSRFTKNRSIQGSGGVLHLTNVVVTLYNCLFLENYAHIGGVIYAYQSSITFNYLSNLTNNTAAETGGAIVAIDSKLIVYSLVVLMHNKATSIGGGAYLHHSELICQIRSLVVVSNNKALRGGGMRLSNTYITILFNRYFPSKGTAILFHGNRAKNGGALYLEGLSAIHIIKNGEYIGQMEQTYNLYFIRNTAVNGAAIYVTDRTYYGVCLGFSDVRNDCFFQVLSPSMTSNGVYRVESILFEQNNAYSAGSILFGGLLDRCTASSAAEILLYNNQNGRPVHKIDGFTYLKNISNLVDKSDAEVKLGIVSLPARACFCNLDGLPDCNYQPPAIEIMKGKRFYVSVAAVDQVNHPITNADVYSFLRDKNSGFGDGQAIQKSKQYCTKFSFNIHSLDDNERLTLYAKGPCEKVPFSTCGIDIEFLACTCPIGFQRKTSEKANCVCECDSRLCKYITECNADNQTLLREGSFWIAYDNTNVNSSGYITYHYCPLDYCLPPYLKVQINLTMANGADVQCANNRSGILCGSCQPGLSLSLGSSRCIPCPNTWYVNFLVILFVSFICGIALVALMLLLNLSVAVGTLNGLIFYANVVNSSKSTFFTSSTKVFSVFISLLNLEVGFDVCFFKGMDTYWKTWLRIAFPMYVILLVVMIIILSRYSIRFSMLIAKKNPVATLATLILLSYTDLLRTIIAVLSQAKLQYPDDIQRMVWLPDGSMDYLTGRHIPLFMVAVLILGVGIAYTLLLFSWQWLLKCMKYRRLCHFFEAYHAPYEFKHRYWTGLLLLARIGIYLLIILYGHGNPNINLLAIIIITSVLLFIKGHVVHRIYKDLKIDIIETISYFNIVLLSAVKIVLLNFANREIYHDIATLLSGTVALLVLIYAISYQVFSEYLLKLWKKIQRKRLRRIDEDHEINDGLVDHTNVENKLLEDVCIPKPTSSTIEGQPPPDEAELEPHHA